VGVGRRRVDVVDDLTGRKTRQLVGHSKDVLVLAFSPNGTGLASGSKDGVRLWDPVTGAQLSFMTGKHNGDVTALVFSPDGNMLCSGGSDGSVALWWALVGSEESVRGLSFKCFLSEHLQVGDEVLGLQFSTDGEFVAALRGYANASLWRVSSGERMLRIKDNSALSLTGRNFSADSGYFVSGRKSRIVVWDLASRQECRVISAHKDYVSFLAFSPRQPALLASVGSRDKRAYVSDTETGAVIATLSHGSWVGSLAWAPDGGTIACSDNGWRVCAWNTRGMGQSAVSLRDKPCAPLATFQVGQASNPSCALEQQGGKHVLKDIMGPSYVAFSACGRSIVCGSENGAGLEVWDACELGVGRARFRFTLHGSCVAIGRNEERERAGALAFAMGHHPRLGECSSARWLDAELVQLVCSQVPLEAW